MAALRSREEIRKIRQFLTTLKQSEWLGAARRWWPDYLFHSTEIQNAVNILRTGELLCRHRAQEAGLLSVDIASPNVIANTRPDAGDYVRLYLRPRTPTQYRNEGFRPLQDQELGAHCPVPIYFLFDSLTTLARADSVFTDGNLASGAQLLSSVADFMRLPFQLIYHDTWFDDQDRNEIIYHRNAEVLVPNVLSLDRLVFIGCRSQAEYETLLYLLPAGVRKLWVDKIGVRPNLRLFFGNWTYVQEVEKSVESVLFRFNRGSRGSLTPGPFAARVEIWETSTGKSYIWHKPDFAASDRLPLSLHTLDDSKDYVCSLSLDGHFAYRGRFQEEELPF